MPGRLYEVEQWINEGRSLDISAATKRGRRRSMLEIAVETGFHSMVELLAKRGGDESSKNAALAQAVSSHRLDLVELLVQHGADINSINLADVLLDWEPKMIRFFLDRGADPIRGRPFPRHLVPESGLHFGPFSNAKSLTQNSRHNSRSNSIAPCASSVPKGI